MVREITGDAPWGSQRGKGNTKYEWDTLLALGSRVLVKGEDFKSKPQSFANLAYGKARERADISLSIFPNPDNENELLFEVTAPEPDEAVEGDEPVAETEETPES